MHRLQRPSIVPCKLCGKLLSNTSFAPAQSQGCIATSITCEIVKAESSQTITCILSVNDAARAKVTLPYY